MKPYTIKKYGTIRLIDVAPERRMAVAAQLKTHVGVLEVVTPPGSKEHIRFEVSTRLEPREEVEIEAICSGAQQLIIDKVNTYYWKVTVGESNRQRVIDALTERKGIYSVTPWDNQLGDAISVRFLGSSYYHDRQEVADLIRQLVAPLEVSSQTSTLLDVLIPHLEKYHGTGHNEIAAVIRDMGRPVKPKE